MFTDSSKLTVQLNQTLYQSNVLTKLADFKNAAKTINNIEWNGLESENFKMEK